MASQCFLAILQYFPQHLPLWLHQDQNLPFRPSPLIWHLSSAALSFLFRKWLTYLTEKVEIWKWNSSTSCHYTDIFTWVVTHPLAAGYLFLPKARPSTPSQDPILASFFSQSSTVHCLPAPSYQVLNVLKTLVFKKFRKHKPFSNMRLSDATLSS